MTRGIYLSRQSGLETGLPVVTGTGFFTLLSKVLSPLPNHRYEPAANWHETVRMRVLLPVSALH
jgi:hypothetical protein